MQPSLLPQSQVPDSPTQRKARATTELQDSSWGSASSAYYVPLQQFINDLEFAQKNAVTPPKGVVTLLGNGPDFRSGLFWYSPERAASSKPRSKLRPSFADSASSTTAKYEGYLSDHNMIRVHTRTVHRINHFTIVASSSIGDQPAQSSTHVLGLSDRSTAEYLISPELNSDMRRKFIWTKYSAKLYSILFALDHAMRSDLTHVDRVVVFSDAMALTASIQDWSGRLLLAQICQLRERLVSLQQAYARMGISVRLQYMSAKHKAGVALRDITNEIPFPDTRFREMQTARLWPDEMKLTNEVSRNDAFPERLRQASSALTASIAKRIDSEIRPNPDDIDYETMMWQYLRELELENLRDNEPLHADASRSIRQERIAQEWLSKLVIVPCELMMQS